MAAMVGEAGTATANDDGPEEKLFAEWRTVAWDEPGNEVTTLTTPNGPCGADKSRSTSSPILLKTHFGIRSCTHPAATIIPSDTHYPKLHSLTAVGTAAEQYKCIYLAGRPPCRSACSSFVLEILTGRGLDRSESELNLSFERIRDLKVRTSSCDPWPGRG